MPRPVWNRPQGELVEITVHSQAVRDNRLGDPADRTVAVYLPVGWDQSGADYPLFVDIVGYTGSGFSHLNWKAFEESVPQRLDRLVAEGRMGPVICAFPDCFTSLGGNQYIDSVVMGRWAEFLTKELPAALEARFPVRKGPRNRALFGKSSGGYGAIVHGLRHAQHWGAVACHSGDMGFDRCYPSWFGPTMDRIAETGGTVSSFMEALAAAPTLSTTDLHALCTLAMAASYDPALEAPYGVRLPFDPHTLALDEALWSRWLAHDPVHLVEDPACQANLRSLRGVYIDCGDRDQYALTYGARQLVRRLKELGIPHTYDEFPGTHSGVDYRMDQSLPFLYAALTGP